MKQQMPSKNRKKIIIRALKNLQMNNKKAQRHKSMKNKTKSKKNKTISGMIQLKMNRSRNNYDFS